MRLDQKLLWGASLYAVLGFYPTLGLAHTHVYTQQLSQSQENFGLAQNLRGQCRQVNTQTFIYREPSVNSESLRVLQPEEEVILDSDDVLTDGWIAISSPRFGFIQTEYLKPCPSPVLPPDALDKCRILNEQAFIYQERSANSQTIRSLSPGEEITLKELSPDRNGWIAIESPVYGFIEARFLNPCGTQETNPPQPQPSPSPTPPSNQSLCRQVRSSVGADGLVVRREPNTSSDKVGKVFPGDEVSLTNPQEIQWDSQNREWVRITSPSSGWVSNGFPHPGEINLQNCF